MNTLLMRSYQGETDLEAIAKLYEDCERVDRLGYWTTIEDLRQSYSSPQFDPDLDLRLWENDQGQLIAVGSLRRSKPGEAPEGFLRFEIHPQFRGQSLERDIIAWGTQRLQQAYQQPGEIKLRAACRTDQPDRVQLLEEYGFVADRYFFQMQRDLHQPIPQPQLPTGFLVRTLNGEQEAEAWVEMFNQTFIDHWNHHDLTLEEYHHYLKNPNYCPNLDLVVTSAEGTFAGFCESQIYPYDNHMKSG